AIGGSGGGHPEGLTGIVDAISSAAAQFYATLLPLADTVTALTTSIPAYDATIFFSELSQGNLFDAIGLPISADVGLLNMLAGFGLAPVGEGLVNGINDLA